MISCLFVVRLSRLGCVLCMWLVRVVMYFFG